MPRLKAEKVKRIKADLCEPNATQPQVAKKHRVSRSAVSDIAQLTEERNRERRKAKAGARDRGLFNAMADVPTEKIVAVKPLPKVRRDVGKKGKVIE